MDWMEKFSVGGCQCAEGPVIDYLCGMFSVVCVRSYMPVFVGVYVCECACACLCLCVYVCARVCGSMCVGMCVWVRL